MITKAFLNPQSIAIIGGSEDTHKPVEASENLIKQITKVVYTRSILKQTPFKAYPVTIVWKICRQ